MNQDRPPERAIFARHAERSASRKTAQDLLAETAQRWDEEFRLWLTTYESSR